MSVAVKSALGGAAGRVRSGLRGRSEHYAFCPQDGFFFRPLYTGGTCPLCGEAVADGAGAESLPLLMRFDRFRFGMTVLVAVWIVMSALVLVVYFD